jgi:hypothetical protein
MQSRRLWLPILLAWLFVSTFVSAQDTASITGTVTDPSGASVPIAEVTVSLPDRGIKRSTTTNESGDFLVAGLPVGTINLTVNAPGFKKYEAAGIVLRVGQRARADVQLQLGPANAEVTVEGAAVAQVETQSSDLTGVVTGKEITQLALNGRNFAQLATLVPGVSNQSGQDEASVGVFGNVAFSINGGRTEYNNWELDGGDNMDNGSNTTLNVYPSLDAIAEFKVLTSNYGAQYGRSGSGTIEVETKSGTNAFHGDLYEFVRNDAFNARNYFNTTDQPKPGYKKNDFGYTIGGPVFIPGLYNKHKDKTFFFWSQEWRKESVAAPPNSVNVPTQEERNGNFSDLCPDSSGSFNDCPVINGVQKPDLTTVPGFNASDPTVQALLGEIPLPTINGTHTWSESPSLPTDWREELVRVDHNFSDKLHGTFRYIHDSWDQIEPSPLWTAGTSFPTIQTNFQGPGVSLVTRLTATASPTLLNEFVFSYTTDHLVMDLVGPNWKRPQGLNWGLFQNGFNHSVPGINLSGGIFNFAEDPGYIPNGPYNSNPTYTYRDNVTKIIGKHNLIFGGYFVAAQKNELSQPGVGLNGLLTFDTSKPISTGNSFADLLLGNMAQFQQTNVQPKFYNRYKIFEPYFQDDFHVTKRLTLNLGLRISMFGTYRDRYHSEYNFDPSHFVQGGSSVDPVTGLVIGNPFNGIVQCGVTPGVPASCMTGHLFNPAPRIGFAWDPFGNGRWAIRGGYGIFFEHTNGNEATAESLEPSVSPAVQSPSVFNVIGYNSIVPQPAGSTSPLGPLSIPSKAVWPYVQQWHFDVEHEILKNTIATVSYVGSKGTHLTDWYNANQIIPTPLSQDPYQAGEAFGPNDCGTSFDAYGVPTNATTPSNTPIPYQVNSQGIPVGPAANLAVALCGANPDLLRTNFPGLSSIPTLQQEASSIYHGLEGSLRRSVGHLLLDASYTYSHAIDNSSSARDVFLDSYNFALRRGSSNFDQRHMFSFSYVYDLPFFTAPGMAHKLLGGWQWSGITDISSGSPFSVLTGGSTAGVPDNAGVGNDLTAFFQGTSNAAHPDVIGNPKATVPNISLPGFGPLLFNPAAFAAPRGLTFGNAGRNILTNPRRTNFDMAMFKHFAISESKAFEFRAEAFNIFNHTQWFYLAGDTGSASSNAGAGTSNTLTCYGGPNNSAGDVSCLGTGANPNGSATYLRPFAAHNPRILQLGAKFIF